jgi:hypothetical protein
MVKGHLNQVRHNLRSTKSKIVTIESITAPEFLETGDDIFPTTPDDMECTHYCYATIFEPTGQVYSDQTGGFIAPSSNGNNYIMIVYDYDSNVILVTALKNREGPTICDA